MQPGGLAEQEEVDGQEDDDPGDRDAQQGDDVLPDDGCFDPAGRVQGRDRHAFEGDASPGAASLHARGAGETFLGGDDRSFLKGDVEPRGDEEEDDGQHDQAAHAHGQRANAGRKDRAGDEPRKEQQDRRQAVRQHMVQPIERHGVADDFFVVVAAFTHPYHTSSVRTPRTAPSRARNPMPATRSRARPREVMVA